MTNKLRFGSSLFIIIGLAFSAVAQTSINSDFTKAQISPDGNTFSASPCQSAGRNEINPISLKDVLNIPQFAGTHPIDLSPDGELVATTLQNPSRAATLHELGARYFTTSGVSLSSGGLGADIVLFDARTGESRNLTGGRGSSWGPSWSPDGKRLVFYSDRDGATRLWVWERELGILRRVGAEIMRPYFGFELPRWSPDGRHLLVKLLPDGMTIKTAADLLPQAADSADKIDNSSLTGSSVTVLASDPSLLTKQTSTAETKTSSVDHFNRSLADLAVIDVTTGKVKRLAKRVKPLAYTFSPNGQRVLYTNVRWHEENGRGDVVYSLIVLDLVSGEQHLLAKDALRSYGLTVSWSPDGRRIVYADASGGLIVVGESEPGAALTSWKELHRFTKTGVRFQTDFTTPLWSDDGRRIYISGAGTLWEFRFDGESVRSLNIPDHHLSGIIADNKNGRMWNGNDGKSAYVVTHNRRTQRKGFFRIPLESNESAEQLWQGDVYMGPVWADIDLSANGATFAFVAQEAKHPQELWLSSDGLRNVSRISKLHSGLDRFTLGESRLIEWASTKGVRLKGVLLLPAGYTPGKCYPLIVHVYPDERPASIVYRFGLKEGNAYNQQLLATRGYAVLIPEIPLSKGNPVDDIAAAVLPAVNHVVELGIADPARVGVTGSSAGGYAALALITRSNLFAAAVADQGFGSLFSYYSRLNDNGNSPSVSYIEDYGFNMGGHPWSERLQPYIEQSPYFQLDKIKTPLLLTHGDSDRIVSSQLSKEIFVGLRRLDKPVVLALYRGENHGIGGWRHDNLEDYWNRVWSWWDRWLGVNRKTIGDNSKQAK